MTDNSNDENILETLEDTVVQRAEQYGPPTDNFQVIADLWSAYLGVEITAYDYAQLMQLAKIGRTRTGTPQFDEELDKMGYAYTGNMIREDEQDE